jgi:hypothetical protein
MIAAIPDHMSTDKPLGSTSASFVKPLLKERIERKKCVKRA